jgi:hypothetical protein
VTTDQPLLSGWKDATPAPRTTSHHTPSTYPLVIPRLGLRAVVRKAARVSGAVADAVVQIDLQEHRRRAECGLGGVESLGMLDALMSLPHGAPVPVRDIGEVTLWHLRRCPEGCVQWLDNGRAVRRLLVPVAAVALVVVRAVSWRAGLRRAAAFEPFTQRAVLLARESRNLAGYAWEADAAGTGLWVAHPDNPLVKEIVAPGEFELRYVRPARWRFTERAYTAWLSTDQTDGGTS